MRQLQRSILDTHRRVAKLEESVGQSLAAAQEETRRGRADMNESLKSTLEEMRRTAGQVDENTHYVRELSQKLDEIKYSVQGTRGVPARPSGVKPPEPEVAEETPAPTAADTGRAPTAPSLLTPVNPEEDYRRAKQDYDRGNLELAKLEFEEYLRLYPDSELAPNAQFWLADCHRKSGDLERAVQEFKKVYTEFPRNRKMADAMLNEAYALVRLERNAEAIKLLKRVISDYPVSPAAQSAKIKLDALDKAGVDISG
jgi:tol-pal system protein YbgF